jgi:3-phenylpropionate/trans-cinnamate dioxygenase ferredoxin reductase component
MIAEQAERGSGTGRVACLTVAGSGRVVVAGAGLAGLRTAEELRARGLAGRITMIGAEARPPYDRPPLSKKVLTESALDPSLQADFAALDVDFRPDEAAVGLDAAALVTSRGQYPFDHLVLATGASPVALPGDGRQRFLRTYDDALALRDLLRPGLRLAIVGAGWIGAELATAAASRGAQVTVVEAGPAPVAAAVGIPVGAQTARWYAAAGVDLRVGVRVQAVQSGGLALEGGDWIPADEIVTAVGVRPAVSWLEGSGVRLENGVAVDAGLPSSHGGSGGGCASSTGMWPCTRPRSSRPTSSAATRYTTRCRTSGPSSSAAWCSTWDTTAPPTASSGAAIPPSPPGPPAGSPRTA